MDEHGDFELDDCDSVKYRDRRRMAPKLSYGRLSCTVVSGIIAALIILVPIFLCCVLPQMLSDGNFEEDPDDLWERTVRPR